MDLNSRINWLPGMEITAQTFIGLEEKLDFQQQIAIRAALGSTQMGMLPGTELSCKGVFVKNTFEVENLRCMALLPSGKIIDADEKAVVPIPMLFGDSYYLTIGISDTTTSFEKEGVPYLRPHYEYALLSLEEAESQDVMPLVHFNVKDGMFSIDTGYIPPCLLMTGNQQFVTYVERYVNKLSTITSHQNLEEGDGKRALLHYLFIMKGYSQRNSVHDFLMLLQEIAHAVDYYIISPNTEQPIAIPQPRQVDVMKWLNWFEDYLTGAVAVLDKVVLVDNTIDYDALLKQAKADLYAQLHEELIVKLLEETKEKLIALVNDEMQNALAQQTQALTDYINNQMKPMLMEELRTDINRSLSVMQENLYERLYEHLYEVLFEHLFNALYVPEPESERFVPLI